MIMHLLTTILISLLHGHASGAGTDSSNALSVRSAYELARKNNPAINALAARINAKGAASWLSLGLSAPRVSFFKEGIPFNGKTFDEKRWTLTQAIDFPLKSFYRISRVGNERAALESQLEADLLSLKAEVKKVYADVLYALALMQLRREALELSQSLRDAVGARFEVGEAPELEMMKADVQLAEAQNDLTEAERQLHRARYQLFNVIGLDPAEQKYGIQFTDSLKYFDLRIDQKRLLASLQDQAAYASASHSVDAAEDGVREAWSSWLPDISASYYRQNLGFGFDNYGFEIGFSAPLWFMFENRGRIQVATATHREATWQQRAVYLGLKKQIEDAWHGYEASRDAILRYEDVIVVRARDLNRLSLEAYRAGESDLLSLLDAQRTYLNSQIRYQGALRDYYHQTIELERFIMTDIVFTETMENSK